MDTLHISASKKEDKAGSKIVETALLFTDDEHLKPTKIEFKNEQTGNIFTVNSSGQIVKQIEHNSQRASTSTSQSVVDQTLYVTGPAKTGHVCTNYTCSENDTFLGPHVG